MGVQVAPPSAVRSGTSLLRVTIMCVEFLIAMPPNEPTRPAWSVGGGGGPLGVATLTYVTQVGSADIARYMLYLNQIFLTVLAPPAACAVKPLQLTWVLHHASASNSVV